MLFIIHGEWVEAGPLATPEQVESMLSNTVVPSLEMLAKWERDGIMKSGGVYPGECAGVFIVEADSAEALGSLLTSLPFWGQMKWHVRPLQTFASSVNREQAIANQIRELAPA